MIVSQILKSKPTHAITTIGTDETINDAARLLAKHRIGALIVSNDGTSVAGILSERDIVREIAEKGIGCMSDKVSDVMTSKVSVCAPGDSAVSILETMTNGRFRHIPVVADGALTGVIPIGDVVKARIDEVEHENSALTEMIAGNA